MTAPPVMPSFAGAGVVKSRCDRDAWIVFAVAVVARLTYFWQHRASPLSGYYVVDHHLYAEWALRIA
ncbi:MAG TPA: hypothetical protein VK137_15785, partial [Planctomycetaceae bacterium]|nr:hypothetical protein [Planctomycetaceae bacterium]